MGWKPAVTSLSLDVHLPPVIPIDRMEGVQSGSMTASPRRV